MRSNIESRRSVVVLLPKFAEARLHSLPSLFSPSPRPCGKMRNPFDESDRLTQKNRKPCLMGCKRLTTLGVCKTVICGEAWAELPPPFQIEVRDNRRNGDSAEKLVADITKVRDINNAAKSVEHRANMARAIQRETESAVDTLVAVDSMAKESACPSCPFLGYRYELILCFGAY